MLRWVTLSALLALATASICPMESHQVCNPDDEDHACVCALTREQASPPKISCNKLIERDEEGNFPVVTVKFNLDSSSEGLDKWPEEDFVEAIATSLRTEEDDVIVLRATCEDSDDDKDEEKEDKLIVQFVILKKTVNESDIPYERDDFLDAESIAQRMKAMGHLSQIANLDVDSIEYSEELEDVEINPDNTDLIIKASLTGAFFGLTFLLGVWIACRNRGYSDDLQKP